MNEQTETPGTPTALTISGPSIALTGEPAVWRVEACDPLGRPIPGLEVVAQLGHGAGRPYRGVTDADGVVEFEFTFSAPSSSIQVRFAAASGTPNSGDRFPDHDGAESVTCAVIASDAKDASPVRLHALPVARAGTGASTAE